jgi:hypothetical protein
MYKKLQVQEKKRKTSVFTRLMSSQRPINSDEPSGATFSQSELPKVTKCLLLNFLNGHFKLFAKSIIDSKQKAKDEPETTHKIMLQMFRYPFVTYLTKNTFSELTFQLEGVAKHFESREPMTEVDLHCLRYTLQLTNCNLMAIKFCSINLSKDLLPVKEDYVDFMKYFNLTVQQIAYDMGG